MSDQTRRLYKVGGVVQDFELGAGRTTQDRAGSVVGVDKVALDFIVESLDQLRNFPITAGYLALQKPNGGLTPYYYDPSSTEAVDNEYFILPASGTGRWVARSPVSGLPGISLAVENISDTEFSLNGINLGGLYITESDTPVTITLTSVGSMYYGEAVYVMQGGLGHVTFEGANGVTVLSPGDYSIRTQNSIVACIRLSNTQWVLAGDISLLP